MEMEIASRNIVVSSRTAGNVEKASGLGRYIASTISREETQILRAISTSISPVGSGMIIMKTIDITITAPTTSERCIALSAMRFSQIINRFMAAPYPIRVRPAFGGEASRCTFCACCFSYWAISPIMPRINWIAVCRFCCLAIADGADR